MDEKDDLKKIFSSLFSSSVENVFSRYLTNLSNDNKSNITKSSTNTNVIPSIKNTTDDYFVNLNETNNYSTNSNSTSQQIDNSAILLKVGKLENEYIHLQDSLKIAETKISNLTTKNSELETKISNLTTKNSELETKIRDLNHSIQQKHIFNCIKSIIFSISFFLIIFAFICIHINLFTKILADIYLVVDLLNKSENLTNLYFRVIIDIVIIFAPLGFLTKIPSIFKDVKEIIVTLEK